jgi:predicted transcriptional regulator
MKNINLRLDDDLHSRLKHIADLDRRSLQQEIIFLLGRACDAFDAELRAAAERGMVYVHVAGKDVIVTSQDDGETAKPREVYRIGPDGESWTPGWRELGQQVIGDESTHHPAGSVIGRAAQKIYAQTVKEKP